MEAWTEGSYEGWKSGRIERSMVEGVESLKDGRAEGPIGRRMEESWVKERIEGGLKSRRMQLWREWEVQKIEGGSVHRVEASERLEGWKGQRVGRIYG